MPTSDPQKTVFISYRRKPAAYIARAIRQDLIAHGYDVFMDVEDMDTGKFKEVIENQIKARAHFLIVLARATVSNFENETDMMRYEIEYAMEHKRHIIPLRIDTFQFNNTKRFFTGKLAAVPNLQAALIHHELFDGSMDKLRGSHYLGKPVDVLIHNVPASDTAEVKQTQAKIPSEPVTETELSAEAYFAMGLEKQEAGDLEGAISEYNQAIEINATYWQAYNNRGVAYYDNGDLSGAIVDYDRAIEINPQHTSAFNNRGNARSASGDLSGAIKDFDRNIEMNPQDAAAYYNRGGAYLALGKYEEAVTDLQQADVLRPDEPQILACLAVTQFIRENAGDAKRIWRELMSEDMRYRQPDWVGKVFGWSPSLVEAARKLIATL